jgi:hypothetical protein
MSDDTPSPLNNVITIDDEGRFPRVDDSAALSSCVELCQAPPTKPTTQSLRRVRPQSFRLQGSRGRAAAIRHPHGCFGQMRARQNAFKG